MSPRNWTLRLEDIVLSITDVKKFTKNMTFDEFKADKKTLFAVVRCFEIIGEAASHVPDSVQNKNQDIPWRKMKDFRNLLAHEYFGVDSGIIWNTINSDLLKIKLSLETILNDFKQ